MRPSPLLVLLTVVFISSSSLARASTCADDGGTCPDGQVADAAAPGTATSDAVIGGAAAHCSLDSDCQTGEYCDTRDGLCSVQIMEGSGGIAGLVCASDSDCAKGQYCDPNGACQIYTGSGSGGCALAAGRRPASSLPEALLVLGALAILGMARARSLRRIPR
jgi:Cys-rich repeat protein